MVCPPARPDLDGQMSFKFLESRLPTIITRTLTVIDVDSNDITAQVSGEQKHYFYSPSTALHGNTTLLFSPHFYYLPNWGVKKLSRNI
jgi:hypothetical protein